MDAQKQLFRAFFQLSPSEVGNIALKACASHFRPLSRQKCHTYCDTAPRFSCFFFLRSNPDCPNWVIPRRMKRLEIRNRDQPWTRTPLIGIRTGNKIPLRILTQSFILFYTSNDIWSYGNYKILDLIFEAENHNTGHLRYAITICEILANMHSTSKSRVLKHYLKYCEDSNPLFLHITERNYRYTAVAINFLDYL
jgi:hypothetical protein